jgi:hypothetical protein
MRLLLAVATMSIALHTNVQGQARTAEVEALGVVYRLFDAMRQNDSAMARPLFHAKARMITAEMRNGEPVVRLEESAESFIRAIGRPRNEVWDERLSNEKVFVDGALASVWTDYMFYRGTTLSHCGVDHFLLVMEGTQWKILEVADTRRTDCRG